MSEYENVFKRKEINEMYSSGDVKPLDDLYLIEDVALMIKEFGKKVDFYKQYKKKKSNDVNDAIQVLNNQINFYKFVIVSTLKHNKEKSIKFPGSCSVSARNQKAKWSINDEEEFIKVLQEAKKAGEDVSDVLEEVIQYNIRKREASKLLMIWEQNGKLDGFLKKAKKDVKDIVVKDPPKTTVSLSFIEEQEDEEVLEVDVPIKNTSKSSKNLDDYDSL